METKRRIILRTEIFERISLRRFSKITDHSRMLEFETYQIVINKIAAHGTEVIFDAEFLGFLEIEETGNETRFICRKKIKEE
jgi:hypothetical protein